ncbi:MAG: hypothetical protein QGG53_07875 [Planctomycetota bacterium]|nr:hypothetical protein [Planctomycetota bacterium]
MDGFIFSITVEGERDFVKEFSAQRAWTLPAATFGRDHEIGWQSSTADELKRSEQNPFYCHGNRWKYKNTHATPGSIKGSLYFYFGSAFNLHLSFF